MDSGIKRAVLVWHRRAGKDKTCLNYTIRQMFSESPGGRIGIYYHLFPSYAQGKKIIWDGIDREGMRFMDHFPAELIARKNETDLQIELVNGSIWQIVGTDNMDRVVGTNPVGCVFSEYALQNPRAWDLFRPILRENGGWAIFPYTPRGRNHGKALYDMARNNPDWYCELLTVRDTRREDGTPVVSEEDIEADRREGMDEELIQQEYYCSFEGYQQGSYYAKQLRQAYDDSRVGTVPWESRQPVFTFWDIGIGDASAIWFMQRIGSRINVIDYYETSGEGISYFAKLLKNDRPYTYARHYWPHDGRNREFGTGVSRRDTGEELGLRPIDIVERGDVDTGIDAVRSIFSRCYFDKAKCEDGLNALSNYRKEWDEDREEFKNKPYHDWSSHGADAFRTMAMSDFETVSIGSAPVRIISSFDPSHTPDVDVIIEDRFDPMEVRLR